MPLSFRLEHVIEHLASKNSTNEKRLLKNLAGVKLSSKEARTIWPKVQDHKWYVSERLGRDVGLKVAAIDYFENVQPRLKMRSSRDTLPPRLPFMQPFGFRETAGGR